MKINSILTDYFCQSYDIDINECYEIQEIDANELIVPERIDLIVKLKYIEYREKGYDLNYIKELYSAHIEAFSHGTYTEPGNNNKDSIEKYFDTFNLLIDNVKNNGVNKAISVIPVGANNIILDGAHRTAIAAYFNLKVPIIRFENLRVDYSAQFFQNRLLDQKYLEYIITEYCKLKKELYFACIWPRAKEESKLKEMDNLINQSCKIIYYKDIKLDYEGLRNFIIQIYSSQEWTGTIENHFAGAQNKVDACYDGGGTLKCYVLESDCFDRILELKARIRDIFKIDNHSVHITDNQEETLQIANLLLNQNSIDFLNNGYPDKYDEFNKKLNDFKKKLVEKNFTVDQFVIDSSSVLALYGLRDVEDLDFMTVLKGYEIIEDNYISNHHNYINFYETTIDDLILNPDNYLIYNDLKFVTLEVLRRMKKNRNEEKDKVDIKLIDSISRERNSLKLYLFMMESWIKRKKRNLHYFIKIKSIYFLRKIGMDDMVRRIYRFLRGIEI